MPSRTWLAICLISIVCIGFLIEAAWVRRTTSLTFDETYYLNCGLQTVHDGWIDRRIAAEGVAPLPVLLTYVPPLILAPREARPDPWAGQRNDPLLIPGPRLCNALLVGAPLIVLVFVWLLRTRDLRPPAWERACSPCLRRLWRTPRSPPRMPASRCGERSPWRQRCGISTIRPAHDSCSGASRSPPP